MKLNPSQPLALSVGLNAVTGKPTTLNHQDAYLQLLASVQSAFDQATAEGSPLFETNAHQGAGLWAEFLAALPAELQQEHNCHACRRFIEQYGHLATVNADGSLSAVMWAPDQVSDPYQGAVQALQHQVESASIKGVFYGVEATWGQPVTESWRHLAAKVGVRYRYKRAIGTASQAMAEKREEHRMLLSALAEFPQPLVSQALTILRSEVLDRSEKCLGVAEWLYQLHEVREQAASHKAKHALTWLASATAPAGFAHFRSGMLGALLSDLLSRLPFEAVKRRFAEKMHPLQYQRPQAEPKAGNIAQAEKLVQELQAAGALERRYARLEEVQALWRPVSPKPDKTADGSVFGHLTPKGKAPVQPISLPAQKMTWEKFARTVLPGAETIELLIPVGYAPFSALATATHPEAPPILQWDHPDARNPVSSYVYHGGSTPSMWNLIGGRFHPVTAITLNPAHWNPKRPCQNQGKRVYFLLEGCRDMSGASQLCLFPEILRSEFHSVRATIEAFSRRGRLTGEAEASACGLVLSAGTKQSWNVTVRVKTHDAQLDYRLDRWD